MNDPVTMPQGPQVGDQLEVEITDIAFGGEGVARSDGLVIFVPFVVTGETTLIEITERKRDFARARLIQVLQPSTERVDPKCSHFGECGGCQAPSGVPLRPAAGRASRKGGGGDEIGGAYVLTSCTITSVAPEYHKLHNTAPKLNIG